jgi:hypothetical protein
MICGVLAMVPEPKNFDRWLVSVKDTDILLSGDKWTIVVNIALDDYDTRIENLKTVLYALRQKIQVHKNPRIFSFDIYWGEIDRLDGMVWKTGTGLKTFPEIIISRDIDTDFRCCCGLQQKRVN